MDYDAIRTAATEYAKKNYETADTVSTARESFTDGVLFAKKDATAKKDAIMSVLFTALQEMRTQKQHDAAEILSTAIDQINRL